MCFILHQQVSFKLCCDMYYYIFLTILANLSIYNPVFSNGPKSLPKNPPDFCNYAIDILIILN